MIPPGMALVSRANANEQDHQPMLSPTKLMMHATIRIECASADGSGSSGTGFFFSMFQTQTESVPVIMTNKHVLGQNATAAFYVTLAKPDGSADIGNMVRVDVPDLPAK